MTITQSTPAVSQEHYELMAQFEREFHVSAIRSSKEQKSLWPQGNIYCHGETNSLFLAYRSGYALGKAVVLQAD